MKFKDPHRRRARRRNFRYIGERKLVCLGSGMSSCTELYSGRAAACTNFGSGMSSCFDGEKTMWLHRPEYDRFHN